MTLKSMTGYGRGECSSKGMKVEVEISSVNRKQFDMRVSMPRALSIYEPEMNENVHKYISRGSINVSVNIFSNSKSIRNKVAINSDLMKYYLNELNKICSDLKIKNDITIRSLLTMPDVIKVESTTDTTETWPLVKKALDSALKHMNSMRICEGRQLAADINSRFTKLKGIFSEIRKMAPTVTESYRKQLLERIQKAGVMMDSKDSQIIKEIAIFADRSDISEELIRLDSHFHQTNTLFKSKEPVGKTLDFLCQELFREINTIGSKANNAEISRNVIEFKAELESIREQVQNIE